jgi:hypothetical protein
VADNVPEWRIAQIFARPATCVRRRDREWVIDRTLPGGPDSSAQVSLECSAHPRDRCPGKRLVSTGRGPAVGQEPATLPASAIGPALAAVESSDPLVPAKEAAEFNDRLAPDKMVAVFNGPHVPVKAVAEFNDRRVQARMAAGFNGQRARARMAAGFSDRRARARMAVASKSVPIVDRMATVDPMVGPTGSPIVPIADQIAIAGTILQIDR